MTMSNHLWFLVPEAILLVGVVFTAIVGLMRSKGSGVPHQRLQAYSWLIRGGIRYVFNPECLETVSFLMPGLGRWVGVA